MIRLSLGTTLFAWGFFLQTAGAQTADLVVTNAQIYTVDPQRSSARAIAVKGNKILAVGDDVGRFIGPGTRRIDAQGKTVIPGIIDSHGHMEGLGASLTRLDLRGVLSEAEIRLRVEAAAKNAKPGEWIRGRGWDQNLWHVKEFPTKESLDAATTSNPVALERVDGHAVWLNSKALELADINAATPDPPGGRILRSPRGPTGVLIDNAMNLVWPKIPKPTLEQVETDLERAGKRCASLGLTEVHDAGIGAQTIEAYRELIRQGRMPVRIYAMLSGSDKPLWNAWLARGPEIGDFLTIRSVKLYADGAMGSRGAAMLEPYSDDPGNTGLLLTPKESLEQTAREAVKAGFQVCTHAIGDRANRTVLDVYAAALGAPGVGRKNDRRFRVEHAQVVSPEDFARFKEWNVIASMQPTHATSDMGWAAARLGGKRVLGAYAWQTFLKLGVHVAAGSDFPVEDPNPMPGFWAAITHGDWFPEQRMRRDQALRSWTIEGAYAAFQEDRKGSLVAGKLADFVMLSDDIMQIPPEAVRKTHVLMTVVDGKIVYQESQ